jgi:hypothetical protein
VPKRLVRLASECHLEALVLEIGIEPGDDLGSLVRVVRPARRDHAHPPAGQWLMLGGRVEDHRIDGVDDEAWIGQLDAESQVRLEAVARLHDRRVRKGAVDLGNARVRPVVEPAIGGNRAVDTMDEAHVGAREATQPAEVEVERVEQADVRAPRDAIQLDREAAPAQLAEERPQELMPATSWRRRELVEEREVGASPSRPQEIQLGSGLARDGTDAAPQPDVRPPRAHAGRARRAAASASRLPILLV